MVDQVVELHCHTHYSPLDGLNTPSEYMERASELGMDAMAITDHGTHAGHREFVREANKAGIKPVLGVEAYISPTDMFDRRSKAKREDGTDVYNHIILLAQNDTGLDTLNRLNRKSWEEGFFHKNRCLLPGQEIVTPEGMKPIEDIVEGDLVMDHEGRFSPVVKTFKNWYSGEMMGVTPSARYGGSMWMTPEHPVLIMDVKSGERSWVPAKDIKAGRRTRTENINSWNSAVCIPKHSISPHPLRSIRVDDYISPEWSRTSDGRLMKSSKPRIRMGKETKPTRFYCDIPEFIELDYDLGRFIGLYVAEGSSDRGHAVTFSFHEDEREYIDFVKGFAMSRFGKVAGEVSHNVEDYHGQAVSIGSVNLSSLMTGLAGAGAKNKHLPDFTFDAPEEFQRGLWEGVMEGDGRLNPRHSNLTQTSKALAWQMRTLGARFRNSFSRVSELDDGDPEHSIQYGVNFSVNGSAHRQSFSDEEYVYRPVKEVKSKSYSGWVYNIEVEGTHSYVSDFVTHNCDTNLLLSDNEGLIVLSGCMNGLIAKALERGEVDEALRIANQYKDVLGDRFFIEIQGSNPEALNHGLLEVADKVGIAPVVTSDCHYARKEDLWVEEAFLILSTNPKRNPDFDLSKAQKMDFLDRYNYLYPDRTMSFQDIEIFLRDYKTHRELFEKQGIYRTDIYSNTNVIASRVEEYGMPTGLDLLPTEVDDPDAELRKMSFDGLVRLGKSDDQSYIDRLNHELQVVSDKASSPYFLVVNDAVSWARENGIITGPGRGSAAGSLICYALGVTMVDPMEHGLLFERFFDSGFVDDYSPRFDPIS